VEPLFRKVDCLSLPVPDLDKALAFYAEGLGQELLWRSESAAGMCLPDSNAELVIHTDERPAETDLTVESVPDAIERFTEAGGTVLVEPFDITIGRCAVVADPWGNTLVLLDTSKGRLVVDDNKRVIDVRDGA
jgi:predicted enzyme related to lactoylglutathione lyase